MSIITVFAFIVLNVVNSRSTRTAIFHSVYFVTSCLDQCKNTRVLKLRISVRILRSIKINVGIEEIIFHRIKRDNCYSCRSPQTRSISGNTSPVVAPLALSVSNPGIVPLVPASDAVKENVGTAPALPSPAAILPDQSCIEAEVSLRKNQLETISMEILSFCTGNASYADTIFSISCTRRYTNFVFA